MVENLKNKFIEIAKKIFNKIVSIPEPNLKGERDIEYSFLAYNMKEEKGNALDFGCGASYTSLMACRKGYNVTAIDLTDVKWYYRHPKLKFVRGDILKAELKNESYDLILNISSIEHVGLKGRFDTAEAISDGDLLAMKRMWELLKPGKIMILTLPIGKERVFYPFHRVYGQKRFYKIIEGYKIVKKEFWVKNDINQWLLTDEKTAFGYKPTEYCYGIGLFILKK